MGDIYRDTLLRYAGYANEVGEAFAPLVPAVVVPVSYGVAITYVIADTVDKFRKSIGGGKYNAGAATTCAIVEGLDAPIDALPTAIGLGTIPFIVKPLDELAEVGMDVTFRKIFAPYLESCVIDFDNMD